MNNIDSKSIPVIIFTLIYLIVASMNAVSKANHEFVLYIGVVFVLLFVVGYLHVRFRLTTSVLWLMTMWGFMHMCGGLLPLPDGLAFDGDKQVLYNWWIIPERFKFDQFVHAYGFGSTTWLVWQVLVKTIRHKVNQPELVIRPTFGLLFLCMMAGNGLGAVNELIEFYATIAVPETNVGGYYNTGWDLVYNLVGTAIVASLIYVFERKS